MTTVASEEITKFRLELENYPPAIKALDMIEDCEGDLEDAAMSLAINVGQEPQLDNAEWFKALANKCRVAICQEVLRENLLNGNYNKAAIALAEMKIIPAVLVTPVLMYVLQQGMEDFCQPLELKL